MISIDQRKVHLLGLPQDNNSSYMSGPALAPPRIREALYCGSANLFTETGHSLNDPNILIDEGDIDLSNLAGIKAFNKIKSKAESVINSGGLLLGLGGDHSVSYPLIFAHLGIYSKLNILHFDAHPDLYDNMLDNPFSHASPFARLMETGKVNRLVQVGIRCLNPHQREQADRFGVEIFQRRDQDRLSQLKFDGPVYLSFDLDALDPAYAPGVSHYEPGGLSTNDVLNIIHEFRGNLIGADVVELNPHRDPGNITSMVAAKITKELVGRMLNDNHSN